MARKPRIHYPGAFYHVMLRGNGGQDIFNSNEDYARFNLLLQEGIERYRHRIHAFCQMNNHVHLVIQVADVSLSSIIQNVSFRYTRYFNTRQKRSGHLFQGRYKALLIDSDSYLVELARYIHCNPVRAGLMSNPDDYQWSSHKAYLGDITLPWLTQDLIHSQFARNRNKAIKLYADFIQEGLTEKHRREFHVGTYEGRILGEDSFSEKALALAEGKSRKKRTLKQIIDEVCLACTINKITLIEPGKNRREAEARAIAAFIVQEEEQLTLTDLGKLLNRDLAAVSRSANRIRKRLKEDSSLSKRIVLIKKHLDKYQ